MEYKYIVYETTNIINNKIYIGIHKTINPFIFDGYLGCGVLNTQPNTYIRPKTKFQYAVKKYGPKNFRRKVLAIFNSLEEASLLEEELVNEQFLKRNDVYNMIPGGISDNFYKKVKCYQYDLNGNFIKEYESIKDASVSLQCDHGLIDHAISRKQTGKGFLWTNVKYEKLDISDFSLGQNHQIPIYVYDKNGNFITKYKNQKIASEETGICKCKLKEARIFGILYNDFYFCEEYDKNYSKARKKYIENRTIYQYDGNTGVFLKEFKKQILAEQEYKSSNINKSIKLKSVCKNGFYWSLVKLDNIFLSTQKRKRKVGQYDLNGNLIYVFESATAAEKKYGTSVWKVLNGTNKSQKGFVFKYLS